MGPAGGAGWYDVSQDGARFLVACPSPTATPSVMTVSLDSLGAVK
jgi:hypothetical protein